MNDQPAGAGDAAQRPPIMVVAQYVKDLSFENPDGFASMSGVREEPQVRLEINTSYKELGENNYEVTLAVHGEAKSGDTTLFIVETAYSGIFALNNVPEESIKPVLLIEAPRLLFPFARAVVANAARDGGFPPLLINPIDFVSLYRQQHAGPPGEAEPANA